MAVNDKQRAFINEYLINGHNATAAYKKAYPNCKGEWDKLGPRLRGKEGIRAEIDKRMAESVEKTDRTVESLDGMYQKAYDMAQGLKMPSAMTSSVTGIARLYGMDKDSGKGLPEGLQIVINEPQAKPGPKLAKDAG